MELNEMEKKLLFQVEGDSQTKILNELYMTVRSSTNSEQREEMNDGLDAFIALTQKYVDVEELTQTIVKMCIRDRS